MSGIICYASEAENGNITLVIRIKSKRVNGRSAIFGNIKKVNPNWTHRRQQLIIYL